MAALGEKLNIRDEKNRKVNYDHSVTFSKLLAPALCFIRHSSWTGNVLGIRIILHFSVPRT